MTTEEMKAWPWERIVRHAVSGLILFATLYLAVMDKTASATVMAGLFIVAHLLTNIDKLESFTAFGINAKLRETLKEAQLTIEQARKMALTSASQTFYLYAIGGRLMGADYRRKNELIQKLNANMVDIGVDPAEARESRRELFEFAQFDMISNIQKHLDVRLQANGITYDKCPELVTYAGDGVGAYDKITDLINKTEGLNDADRDALLAETRTSRDEWRKSIEMGSFTERALAALEDD